MDTNLSVITNDRKQRTANTDLGRQPALPYLKATPQLAWLREAMLE
jgi:hypothetical protein